MRTKYLFYTLVIALAPAFCPAVAQETGGIRMQHDSWADIVATARAEGKLIFADFYTEWCGPCLTMEENIFTLPTVGSLYNAHFVNTRVDAEHGEGVALAARYGVRLFPTYLFIDPATEEIVHRSSSNQSAAQFIYTGQSALDPQRRSPYLEAEYARGNTSRQLLANYIRYQHAIYQRDKVSEAFDRLLTVAQLTDPDVWQLFSETIGGMDNPYFARLVAEHDKFVALFGKKAVDSKLARETTYGDLATIEALPDFDGKHLNIEMIRINASVRNRDYAAATARIDRLLADTTVHRQDMIEKLKFAVRTFSYDRELPEPYFIKYLEYLRFIAYNDDNRRDPYIHQEYAAALEQALTNSSLTAPCRELLTTPPVAGRADYTMRLTKLKPKPKK